jgi:hypothetical protein
MKSSSRRKTDFEGVIDSCIYKEYELTIIVKSGFDFESTSFGQFAFSSSGLAEDIFAVIARQWFGHD